LTRAQKLLHTRFSTDWIQLSNQLPLAVLVLGGAS